MAWESVLVGIIHVNGHKLHNSLILLHTICFRHKLQKNVIHL